MDLIRQAAGRKDVCFVFAYTRTEANEGADGRISTNHAGRLLCNRSSLYRPSFIPNPHVCVEFESSYRSDIFASSQLRLLLFRPSSLEDMSLHVLERHKRQAFVAQRNNSSVFVMEGISTPFSSFICQEMASVDHGPFGGKRCDESASKEATPS